MSVLSKWVLEATEDEKELLRKVVSIPGLVEAISSLPAKKYEALVEKTLNTQNLDPDVYINKMKDILSKEYPLVPHIHGVDGFIASVKFYNTSYGTSSASFFIEANMKIKYKDDYIFGKIFINPHIRITQLEEDTPKKYLDICIYDHIKKEMNSLMIYTALNDINTKIFLGESLNMNRPSSMGDFEYSTKTLLVEMIDKHDVYSKEFNRVLSVLFKSNKSSTRSIGNYIAFHFPNNTLDLFYFEKVNNVYRYIVDPTEQEQIDLIFDLSK